jgi:glycosyltransferase involved in cell wall biosynthesis
MLSILIPSRNEKFIDKFVHEVESLGIAHEIIISKDSESKGKGWCLREALKESKGDLIAFIDGDGDIPPRMFRRLLPFLEDFDVVVGSKRITHSPLRRKIMTHVTRIWFRFLYGVQADTQTGIKLFRRKALKSINWTWEANGFIFDAEIIARLQRAGVKIVEVPIECEIRRQLAFKTIFRIAAESIWLKWRLLFR